MASSLEMSTCETTSNISNLSLDHPEVLDRETLIEILSERSIPSEEISNLEKADLVSLFYKYAAPLPQRLHQLRRGKRKPPKCPLLDPPKTVDGVNPRSRKRVLDNEQLLKSKVQKSDLSHIIINKGSSKHNSDSSKVCCPESDVGSDKSETSPASSQKESVIRTHSDKEIKSKPIKLNRKSIAEQVTNSSSRTSISEKAHVDGKVFHFQVAGESSSSESMDEDVHETKNKFKKVAITWP